MLKYIYDLFINLVSAIAGMIQFAINLITSLVRFIVMIPQYLTQLISVIGFMPAILIPFAVASITVAVVKFMINRNG